MNYTFDYGKKKIDFIINSDNLIADIKANNVQHKLTGKEEILRAMNEPMDSPKLKDIVKKGETVCIVTSDITRPCPSDIMLPPIIEELIEAGIRYEDISIVLGLGSHRKHTAQEIRKLVGASIYEKVHTLDSDPDDVILLGKTTRGTPVNVFSVVAKADRRICLGNIEMHYFAGYSGGAKAIMPGVSNRDAIQANHKMMTEETSIAGKIYDNNLRLDIDEAGGICGIDYLLNVVLDEAKNVIYAVAGNYLTAHRSGCEYLDRLYKITIPKLADIVIASPGGYPKDINIYQAQKALDNAKHAVKPGGIIILAADCSEGFGEDVFEKWLNEAVTTKDLVGRINLEFRLGGHKAAAIAMVVEKCKEVLFVSQLDPKLASKTFMTPFSEIQAAVDHALEKLGINSSIIIMSHAASTLPTLSTVSTV